MEESDLSLEKIVVNSLMLLGFASYNFPKDMKINIDYDMFKKYFILRSNSKAIDSILYFLFSKICPGSLGVFVFSWPPRTPDMKREFKEETFKLITRLEQETKIPENTILGKSVLESAQGERVWSMLKVLCDCAMKYEIKGIQVPYFPNLQLYIQNPALSIRSSVMRIKRSMVMHIKVLAQKFNTQVQTLQGRQEAWGTHAKFLISEHKSLRNLYDTLINKKKKIDPNTHMMEKLAALDRVPQIDMLKYIWKNIDQLESSSANRNGEFVIENIVNPIPKKKIQDNIQLNLLTWTGNLKSISSDLGKKNSQTGIQKFAAELRGLLEAHKSKITKQSDLLKSHKDQLQSKLSQLKDSINSYRRPL